MQDLEFDLWTAVIHGPRRNGHLEIDLAICARLSDLARQCGGWIMWDDDVNGEGFVSIDEWERVYDRWIAGRDARFTGDYRT